MTPWSHAHIGPVGGARGHVGSELVAACLAGQALAARARAAVRPLLAGVLLVGMIVGAAFGVRQMPGFGVLSPMIVAVVLGMGFRQAVGVPAHARLGVAFSARRLLRLGIVLLGLQLTATQVLEVGAAGLAILASCVVATFAVTVGLGRLLGVEPRLAELIAGGTSICGASAIVATNTVTEAPEEDVAYALAAITLFGSIAMLVYPLLAGVLGLSPQSYGLWAGASIHEVAQVVGASFQAGQQAGEAGTIAKLSRVALLAPMVIALGLIAARRRGTGTGAGRARPPVPWFVLGFVAVVILSSVVPVPAEARAVAGVIAAVLLSAALAALGLEANVGRLRAKGARPLALAGLATLFIAGFSLALVKALAA